MGLEGGPIGAQKAALGVNDLTRDPGRMVSRRNATSRAASSGSPTLRVENLAESSCLSSSVIHPVSVGPGLTAFTVIPLWPTSAASVRVKASIALLVAA
jgi:hypothetical protein